LNLLPALPMLGFWDPTSAEGRGYDDAVTMSPSDIIPLEDEATGVSDLACLGNIAHGIPLNLRDILFTVQAARMAG